MEGGGGGGSAQLQSTSSLFVVTVTSYRSEIWLLFLYLQPVY